MAHIGQKIGLDHEHASNTISVGWRARLRCYPYACFAQRASYPLNQMNRMRIISTYNMSQWCAFKGSV